MWAGKTYTMMGEPSAPGVMPLAVSDLFRFAAEDDDCTWRFGLTYVEIYNERVKDLVRMGAGRRGGKEEERGRRAGGEVRSGGGGWGLGAWETMGWRE